jgi:hypothetical protein
MGHVACMGEVINVYKISFGRPEGKKPLGKLKGSLEKDGGCRPGSFGSG